MKTDLLGDVFGDVRGVAGHRGVDGGDHGAVALLLVGRVVVGVEADHHGCLEGHVHAPRDSSQLGGHLHHDLGSHALQLLRLFLKHLKS